MTDTKKNRLKDVQTLISSGIRSSRIAELKSKQWGVSERQVYKYISEVKQNGGEKDRERQLNDLSNDFDRFKKSDDKYKVWEETDFDTPAVYEIPDERKEWNRFIRHGWARPERIKSIIQKDKTGLEKLDAYCEGVRCGEIVVCNQVRQAVDGHYQNLKQQFEDDFPYYFEPLAALHYIRFFERLKHHTGIKSGEPIVFEPWQWFSYGSVFGWLKKQRFHGFPLRRFKTATLVYPKKNGKSTISGNTGIYMAEFDGWPGAQCFIIATSQSHAMELGYRDATITVDENDWLSERFEIKKGGATIGIYCNGNNSYYKPITSKEDSEDGKNVHFCGPDETKDLEDPGVYNLMEEGMVSAPNGLMMNTSTEGFSDVSLLADQRDYLENVLDPNSDIEDDTLFGVVYTVDESDRYEDGKEIEGWWSNLDLYKKANPNYGISVFEDAIKAKFQKAKNSLDKRSSLITKHLNVRTSSNSALIASEKWNACGTLEQVPIMFKQEDDTLDIASVLHQYRGKVAFGALDLGGNSDFTAFELVFEDGKILSMFWIPEDTIPERQNSAIVSKWTRQGYIYGTPGDWTDHDFVEECIKEAASIVDLQEVAYDRYKMNQMVTHLENEGIEMTPFGQGYASMAPAIDHLEDQVLKKNIEHFGNPVLSWMNGNVSVRKDPAGNRKFDKDKSKDKIDGMVALAMALYRSSISEETTSDWDEVKFIDMEV